MRQKKTQKNILVCAYVDVLIFFCLNKITQNPDKKKKVQKREKAKEYVFRFISSAESNDRSAFLS